MSVLSEVFFGVGLCVGEFECSFSVFESFECFDDFCVFEFWILSLGVLGW